jgi:hypothetical protein
VQDDVLYIFSGTFERGDQEFTMDEMWAIDLNKLDGVKEIFRRELQDWQGAEDEESEEDEDDEDDSEDDEMSDVASTAASNAPTLASTVPTSVGDTEEEMAVEEISMVSDGLPYPRPFESLREFYDRTRVQWQEIIIEYLNTSGEAGRLTVKEISTKAFDRAEDKWWDSREEIRVLEDEQAEAGIGEVVSLADKEEVGGGVGRRR